MAQAAAHFSPPQSADGGTLRAARLLPVQGLGSLLWGGFTGEIWIQPGKEPTQVGARWLSSTERGGR